MTEATKPKRAAKAKADPAIEIKSRWSGAVLFTAKGATTVNYVQPDEDGAYGEWPEDFGDVELKAQDAYLTAVGERHFGKSAN